MIFLIFLQIGWQIVNKPYDETQQELIVYFSISSDKLKYVAKDSLFYAEYESQLKVYDKKGNQLMGDYWEVKKLKDTLDISDSVKIIIPKNSNYFDLKILDCHAGQIFKITEKILHINYIGNIRWYITNDTLSLTFSIINPEGNVDTMVSSINGIKKNTPVKAGNYDDTLSIYVAALPNDNYNLRLEMFSKSKRIDEIQVPIKISRLFYLDKSTWDLKVNQLEYIATPSEIKKLKNAEKAEKDSSWRTFWKQHDPTPNTEYNEKEVEYFTRIEYCEAHFSHGDKGWRSDRAKIYVKYGHPDEIQSYPYYSPPKNPYEPIPTLYDAYEVWYYYKVNRQFIFGDRYGLGQYILLNPEGSNL